MTNTNWPARLTAPFSLEEVHSSISSDTAPGLDRVQYTVLKTMPDSTLLFLRQVLNTITIWRRLPATLCKGEVVLLHKGGLRLDLNNY